MPAHEKNAAVHIHTKVFVNVGRAVLQKKEASSPDESSLRGAATSFLESFAKTFPEASCPTLEATIPTLPEVPATAASSQSASAQEESTAGVELYEVDVLGRTTHHAPSFARKALITSVWRGRLPRALVIN